MLRVSDIVEEQKLFNSNAFKQLTPVLQDAVKQIYKTIEEDENITVDNLAEKFELAVDNVATINTIEKEQLEGYFDDEITEQLEKLGEE
jgi:predicted transcriptional regulator